MTREYYTTFANYKGSYKKNKLNDWDQNLKFLWLEFHEADIKQVENWRSGR